MPVKRNPIDAVWEDRPEASKAHLVVQPDQYAGKNAAEKRTDIADWLAKHGADAAVLSALDSIAWAFNVRGADVARTPVALAYALVNADGTADLFVAGEKIDAAVRQHLGNGVRLHERSDFDPFLATLKGKTVAVDPERAVAAIFEALEKAGAKILPLRDPTVLPKAIKNAAEIAGQKNAQARDGAAISRFLKWVEEEAPKGELDELTASDHLEALRRESPELRDLSFDTISGAGPNGAIVHYRSAEKTNRKLETRQPLSGRFGRPICRRHHRHHPHRRRSASRPTRCATASPAFCRAISPSPRRCSPRARAAASSTASRAGRCGTPGLDYAHGTGHGVGSFLGVHEGPQRIAPMTSAQAGGDEPLAAGMILSNEPGYYKTGAYGIRIENLVLVVEKQVDGAEKEMLGFETLTFAPIERRLIVKEMLSPSELAWLERLSRRRAGQDRPEPVRGDDSAWLEDATAPSPSTRTSIRDLSECAGSGAFIVLRSRPAPGRRASIRLFRAPAFRRLRFSRSAAASRLSRSVFLSCPWPRSPRSRVDTCDALTVKGATSSQCCRSSVVERILGKAEVVSSILTGSTISFSRLTLSACRRHARCDAVLLRQCGGRAPGGAGGDRRRQPARHRL